MTKLKILVIGSGGREHTLVWKLAQSKRVEKIYCAPGNVGMTPLAELVPLKVEDIGEIVRFCQKERIDLVVVGPELPLTLGLVDALEEVGVKAFGPNKQAAELEGSKVFAKDLMTRYRIPTARYEVFNEVQPARDFAREISGPWVVKADGLAAGKGVLICSTLAETEQAIEKILVEKAFGAAGEKVIIEEFLVGEELSLMAFCDGKTVVPMVSAQDHKRVFAGDKGPNTGGMGAYSPAPVATPELCHIVLEQILQPTVQAMAKEGRTFKGVLYAGLMITEQGPRVLEYNVRFGDPETQVILPRLKSDLVEILLAVCTGELEKWAKELGALSAINSKKMWQEEACATVVMASRGYPGTYRTGFEIKGLTEVPKEVLVFHSGTAKQEGKIVTAGGRVLAVTALGGNLRQAVDTAYRGVAKINFTGAHYREDIAYRAFRRC
ncbi:MAG TPA: phosphoribosylamine--glycine ligase [Clostridia bacterium]|nr:phosphoribosylamine--glycine ligase [Clostridia bacterium]HHY05655.1 phosphoribosylamine--glycine ligase [Clostridia bacterium]